MARYRVSAVAKADISNILAKSAEQWGIAARRRYAALLMAAIRIVADDPENASARRRNELIPGIRSFHIRHAKRRTSTVRTPVHVIYYRPIRTGLIEIVAVLHERMEPRRHLGSSSG